MVYVFQSLAEQLGWNRDSWLSDYAAKTGYNGQASATVEPTNINPIADTAAIDFLNGLGMSEVRRHEIELTNYAYRALKDRYGDDITIHGPRNTEVRGAVLSFAFRGIHPHDISQVLDQKNVCVRAGHHCAKPLMRLLGANATARASFYIYNLNEEVDALSEGLAEVEKVFARAIARPQA